MLNTKTEKILSVVGLILIGVIAWGFSHRSPNMSFGVTNQCASGQTCIPSLELTGSTGGVTNSLQIDSGILDNAGTLTQEGASTFSAAMSLTSTFKLGSTGTALSKMIVGTCTLQVQATIAATSTGNVDCPATGAVSGDKVFVVLAASSTQASQYVIKGATASTTADHIEVSLLNLTGVAAAPQATQGFGSSTMFIIIR